MEFNKANLKRLRQEIDEALGPVAEKNEIQLSLGSISFSSVEFTAKLKAVAAGSKDDADRMRFEKNAWLLGLKPEDFGVEVDLYGKLYRIVEVEPKRPKYPLVGEREGKRFKLPLNDFVRKEIEKKRKEE